MRFDFVKCTLHSRKHDVSSQLAPMKPVPEGTASVAHAANPMGDSFVVFRGELEECFKDGEVVDILLELGEASPSSLQLGLVTILQFRENLSDWRLAPRYL